MRGYRLFAIGLIVCVYGMSSGCKSPELEPYDRHTGAAVASAASSEGVLAESSPATTPRQDRERGRPAPLVLEASRLLGIVRR